MNGPRELRLFIVPPGHGAGFEAQRAGGLVLLRPLSEQALHWLQDRVAADARWFGDKLVLEARYFLDIADAIIDAGFLFEGDPDAGLVQ